MTANEIGNRNRFLLAQAVLEDIPPTMKTSQSFPAGEALFVEGQSASGCFIVQEGEVELLVSAENGASVVISAAGPGEMVGICAAFTGEHYSLTAKARTNVRAIPILSTYLMHLIETKPELRLAILQTLSENVQHIMRSSARIRLEGKRGSQRRCE